MKQYKHNLIIAVFICFLYACSPVYQTQYSYYPITGREGQMCSNTCLVAKQECIQREQLNYQQCENQANFQYQLCQGSQIYGYNSDGKWVCITNCYCYRQNCQGVNFSFCEENYKDCYLNCGGDVVATTSCVRNCEEASPPQTQTLRKNEYGSIVDVSLE